MLSVTAHAQNSTLRPVNLLRAEVEYRAMRDRNEKGTIPDNALPKAAQQAQQMKFDPAAWPGTASSTTYGTKTTVAGIDTNLWTWMGPGNIGGRIRAILIHPTATNIMWIGGVDGGIWKTTNSGASWFPLNDFMANLAVVTLVMDPTNPNVIFAGTGEGTFNIDAVRGAGVFKTTDGGSTWAQLSATANSSFYYVNRLSICPTNNLIILAATGSGIWRSTDGGTTWSQRNSSSNMEDIMFDPSGANAIASGNSGQLMYSTDGGVTWNNASGISTSQRIEVAYAASSPNIVYASANISSGQIFVSSDGGQTYSLVSTPAHLSTQGWYDNCIWVDPTNPNLIVFGGTDVYRSTNGGTNYTDIGGYAGSIHPDQHAIVGISGYNGSSVATVFVGNDGGIFRAANITTVSSSSGWTTLNNNLGITQYYGAAGNNSSGTIVGGTQDNGTLRVLGTGGTGSFTSMFGGDGGFCAADQSDTNYFYGEYVYLQIHRSSNGGASSSYITGGLGDAGLPDSNGVFQVFFPPDDKTPPADDPDGGGGTPPPDPDSAANFIAPFILDPNNFNTMLAGGSNLWRSVNVKAATPSWSNIKPGIASGSFINALTVAPGSSDVIWVGHNSGAVYYTSNGTAATPTWTQSGSGTLPARACTRLAIDPNNYNNLYATFGGYSSGNVYRSTNGGATWSNIGAALPSAPANSIVIAPFNSSYLYVGMNVGVFASTDGGTTWSTANLGAANVAVDELFWMNNNLLAATHGRGLFKVAVIPDALQVTPSGGFAATGYVGGPFSNTNQTYVLTNVGASSLNWSLANTSAWLQVSLASGTLTPGGAAASVTVNLSGTAASLGVGSYAATIFFTNTSDGYVTSRPFTLQVQSPPDALVVGPAAGLSFSGVPGSLSGASLNFNLTNIGVPSLNWSLRNTSVWFNASASAGTLAGSGGTAAVNVTLTAAANLLAAGSYTNTVWFTNRNNSVVQPRSVVLNVQPLVSNGGFELGNFTYWTTNGNFQYCAPSSSATYVHSGTYGAEMGPSGSLSYLSQTLNTTPGGIYSLSFWLVNPNTGTPNEFTAAWNGTNVVDLVNLGATGWVNYQYFVTATTGSTVIQFGFRNDPNYWGFDDVTVTPVPAPTFQSVTQQAGTNFVLSWGTQAGLVYQTQYTTNLGPANWINLGGAITAAGSSLTATDLNAVATSPRRFYRLIMLP